MGWFSSPSPSPSIETSTTTPTPAMTAPTNLATDLKPSGPVEKVKDEKARRDECMLFSTSDDPQEDCKGIVARYKDCMAGYGFKI